MADLEGQANGQPSRKELAPTVDVSAVHLEAGKNTSEGVYPATLNGREYNKFYGKLCKPLP